MQGGSHILYFSRIRKNVKHREQRTDKEQTENGEQTEKPITEGTLIVNGLLG